MRVTHSFASLGYHPAVTCELVTHTVVRRLLLSKFSVFVIVQVAGLRLYG